MKYGKGQASFELILLVAFVITISILIGSYFFQDSENSKLLANSKSVFLRELNNENGFYSIQQFDLFIDSASPPNKTLKICLIPSIPASEESIKNAIRAEVPGIEVEILSVSTSKNICW